MKRIIGLVVRPLAVGRHLLSDAIAASVVCWAGPGVQDLIGLLRVAQLPCVAQPARAKQASLLLIAGEGEVLVPLRR